jgi:hypothetical protein
MAKYYGVWITGKGWLKTEKGIFASEEMEVAQSAARFWAERGEAMPIDESAQDFEPLFLAAEQERLEMQAKAKKHWWSS